MRHGQHLSFDELRHETARAVEASTKTQTQIAEELGITRGSVSRAIRESGKKFAELQRRLIAHLTPYQVEPGFQILRKTADEK